MLHRKKIIRFFWSVHLEQEAERFNFEQTEGFKDYLQFRVCNVTKTAQSSDPPEEGLNLGIKKHISRSLQNPVGEFGGSPLILSTETDAHHHPAASF